MGFQSQREKLRLIAKSRIDAGDFTITKLAAGSGLSQPHLSNFLNNRRDLSDENRDKLWDYLNLSVDDLNDPPAFKKVTVFDPIPLVKHYSAIYEKRITSAYTIRPSSLRSQDFTNLSIEVAPARADWTRFVAIALTDVQIASMAPPPLPKTILVIDRHDQFPIPAADPEDNPEPRKWRSRPSRIAGLRDLHAVADGRFISIGHLTTEGPKLLVRPQNGNQFDLRIPLAACRLDFRLIVGCICSVWVPPVGWRNW